MNRGCALQGAWDGASGQKPPGLPFVVKELDRIPSPASSGIVMDN